MINEHDVASLLKSLRKNAKMTAKESSVELKKRGIEISKQTIYGYESGLSMPNADVFLMLCQIYQCDNPIHALFGNSDREDSVILSSHEREVIAAYRVQPAPVQQSIDRILQIESEDTQKSAPRDSLAKDA